MKRAFEKILNKLEELGWVFADYYPDGTEIHRERKRSVPYDKVVEIVNQVASEVGEEVCEWKEDMTLSRSAIGHGKFESLMYVCKWKYCPYCGKKIKVVEPYKAESEG